MTKINNIMFPCACGSNVGELSYKIAKKLQDTGFLNMESTAKITAGIEKTINDAKQSNVIALDGCGLCCAKKALATKDIISKSIIITNMNVIKGKTEVSEQLIDKLANRIKEDL